MPSANDHMERKFLRLTAGLTGNKAEILYNYPGRVKFDLIVWPS